VWVSNESQATRVWFDDLKVTHRGSRVTQATDYYAFGSVMREQKTEEDARYRFGYQGQFAEKDEETGWSHFELREYDPIIARWLVPDPMRVEWSPYIAMGNNPIRLVDPDGGCPDCDDWWDQDSQKATMLEEVSVTPGYDEFLDDFSDLFSSFLRTNPKFGVRFIGDGSEQNFFSGVDYGPGMKVVTVNVGEMKDFFEMISLKNPTRPKKGTFDSDNPNDMERAKNLFDVAENLEGAKKALYEAIKQRHERYHKPFVRQFVFKEGVVYDTMTAYTEETAKKAQLSPVITLDSSASPEAYQFWKKRGENQWKKK
jgi:RHS repeat-associated protein